MIPLIVALNLTDEGRVACYVATLKAGQRNIFFLFSLLQVHGFQASLGDSLIGQAVG